MCHNKLLFVCLFTYLLFSVFFRLGRPGVSVQVRHDPVPDPSAAGSGVGGAGGVVAGSSAAASVGAGGGSGVPGGGIDRGSNVGMASGSAGVNHHSGSGTGPGVANISSGSGSSSSLLAAAGGATGGGHNPVGSSAQGVGPSSNVPSNHVMNIQFRRRELAHFCIRFSFSCAFIILLVLISSMFVEFFAFYL